MFVVTANMLLGIRTFSKTGKNCSMSMW